MEGPLDLTVSHLVKEELWIPVLLTGPSHHEAAAGQPDHHREEGVGGLVGGVDGEGEAVLGAEHSPLQVRLEARRVAASSQHPRPRGLGVPPLHPRPTLATGSLSLRPPTGGSAYGIPRNTRYSCPAPVRPPSPDTWAQGRIN